MDALSLIANIIAVLDAASTVAKQLRTLSHLRRRPEELLQFENEISDFQVVITILHETIGPSGDIGFFDMKIKVHLVQLLKRATALLLNFNKTTISKDTTNGDVVKFWLKTQSHLRKLSAELKAIRTEINIALATVTASEAPRIRIQLDELSAQREELLQSFQQFESCTAQQINSLSNSLGSIRSSLDSNQKTMHGVKAASSSSQGAASRSPIRLQTSLSRPGCATKLCSCRCHKITTRKLPPWLQQVVGFLLIGYSGMPYSCPCNERNCRREDKTLLTVTYSFPWWFWNNCIISFRDRWDPLEGHVISVRTPRIVSAYSPIFHMAVQGDIKGLQNLFSRGLASPFDISRVTGQSALHIAAIYWKLETFEFLLNQYADPYLETYQSISPIDYLWNQILIRNDIQRSPTALQAASPVFNRFLDPTENLQHRNFTTIHKIVLGISSINVEAQLETYPSEIDSQCTLGATPLHWAVSRNDDHIQTLLGFGASLFTLDVAGRNAIHRAAQYGSVKTLELLLAAAASRPSISSRLSQAPLEDPTTSYVINLRRTSTPSPDSSLKFLLEQQNQFGDTPLILASDRPNCSLHVELLLDYSANIDAISFRNGTSLQLAIQNNSHATVDLLLQRQARVDIKDAEDMGTLHVAGGNADLKTLTILKRYAERIIEAGGNEDKDIYGHIPLQRFDIVRRSRVIEDEETHFKCREIFLSLLRLEPEEADYTSEGKSVQESPGSDAHAETSEDNASDVFLDVEQDPEGPI